MYNYKFGVCMLMADKRDMLKPLQYLEFAVQLDEIPPEAYYYLGLAYHYNYRFSEAIRAYNTFLQKSSRRLQSKLNANRQIEMCYNGIALLSKVRDLYVIESSHVGQRNFQRSYVLNDFGGRFLALPEELRTHTDKRMEHYPLVFFNESYEYLYFSSYGENIENGKDIYRVLRNEDGTWGTAERLPDIINTVYEDDYPFASNDGKTLYFSSKGHNSMGGYDIFRTTFDTINDTWTPLENLDFAINTPFDDILFITDPGMEFAYFASDRVSDVGMINVYKVRVDTRPDTEILSNENIYNLSQDDPSYRRALEILRNKTQLAVNATESMFERSENATVSNETAFTNNNENRADTGDLSNAEIIRMAFEQADETRNELNELKMKQDASRTVAELRKQRALLRTNEARRARSEALRVADPRQREEAIIQSSQIQAEADRLTREAEVAEEIYGEVSRKILQKERELRSAESYAENIQSAINSQTPELAIGILESMIAELSVVETDEYADRSIDEIIAQADSQLPEARSEIAVIKDNINEVKSEAQRLREEASNTRNRNAARELNTLAETRENEAREMQMELNQMLAAIDENFVPAENVVQTTTPSTNWTNLNNRLEQVSQELKTSINSIKEQQESLNIASRQKASESQVKYNRASVLITEAESISDSAEKERKLNEARRLLDESSDLVSESVAMKSIASRLDDIISREEQREAELIKQVAEYQSFVENEQTDKAEALVDEISTAFTPARTTNLFDNSYVNELRRDLAQNESESQKSTAEADSLFEQYNKNFNEIQSLNSRLNATTDTREKERITRQITSLQSENVRINTNAENALNKANEYNFEVGRLRMEIAISTSTVPITADESSTNLNTAEVDINLQNVKDRINEDKLRVRALTETTLMAETQTQNQNLVQEQETTQLTEIVEPNEAASEQRVQAVRTESQNIRNSYNELIETFEVKAERLNNFASEKSAVSRIAIEEADRIIENAGNIADQNTRNTEIEKANSLYQQAFTAAQEAIASSDLASEFETQIQSMKSNKQFLESALNEIETIVQSGETDRAENIIQNLKTEWDSEKIKENIENKINETNNRQLTQKQNEAEQLLRISERQYQEAQRLKAESENLIRESQNTDNTTERQRQLAEAAQIMRRAEERQNTANQNYNRGNQLEIEVGVLKMKVEFTISTTALPETTTASSNRPDVINEIGNLQNIIAQHDFSANQENSLNIDENLRSILEQESINTEITQQSGTSPQVVNLENLTMQLTEVKDQAAEARRSSTTAATAEQRTQHAARANELDVQARDVQLQIFELQTRENKDRFEANKNNIAQIKTQGDDENTVRARLIESEANYYYERAEQRRREAAATELKSLQMNLMEDAIRNETMAIQKQNEAIELYNRSRQQANLVAQSSQQTNSTAVTNTQQTTQQITTPVTNTQQTTQQTTTPVTNTQQTTQQTTTPVTNTQQTSQQTTTNITSTQQTSQQTTTPVATTQLPTNPTDRNLISGINGLFFTVQIGVFGGSRTESELLNLVPVFFDRLPNGWYRYFSGIYNSRNTAVTAKNEIVRKGIEDAFVVAYYNGRRISVSEAEGLLEAGQASLQTQLAFTPVDGTTSPSMTTQSTNTTQTGLYYSVQVGVYRNQRTPAELFNITPLEYEILGNGLQRHLHGKFNARQAADLAKNDIVRRGVSDAFVVAYYNGRRISLAEARSLEEQGVSPVMAGTQTLQNQQTTTQQTTPRLATNVTTTTETATEAGNPAAQQEQNSNLQSYNRDDVVFKVQIGAYREALPMNIINYFKTVSGHDIEVVPTRAGLIVYHVGNFKDFNEASELRTRIISNGIPDAFVVAFNKNERIPINVARDILR
ncbi:MAG: hypothetical protein PHT69_03545 [Bacteroidales bacterium]|nr:hypothetical protein [Bacteroidales bacterium]